MIGVSNCFLFFELLSSPYIENRLENDVDFHNEPIFKDLDLPISMRK